MDAQWFDHLVAQAARRPTRRSTLRVLAGGLLGAVLPARLAHAQRSDRDNDGLFDDDEINVYGTNPDIPDTDGDGPDDGQEVFDGTNPLVNENAPPPAAPAPTCSALGGACAQFSDCCPGEYVQCCFNIAGTGTCQDVSQTSFVCTSYADVPATGCPVGTTNCGGFCTNLATDHGNCGACGNSCAIDSSCTNSTCVFYCAPGLVDCGGYCADLQSDYRSCGVCGNHCGIGTYGAGECIAAKCVYPQDF